MERKPIKLHYDSLKRLANDINEAILSVTDGGIQLAKITNNKTIFMSIATKLEKIYLERAIND